MLSQLTDPRSNSQFKIHLIIIIKISFLLRDSSMVEQLAVNQWVPGSSPGRGVKSLF